MTGELHLFLSLASLRCCHFNRLADTRSARFTSPDVCCEDSPGRRTSTGWFRFPDVELSRLRVKQSHKSLRQSPVRTSRHPILYLACVVVATGLALPLTASRGTYRLQIINQQQRDLTTTSPPLWNFTHTTHTHTHTHTHIAGLSKAIFPLWYAVELYTYKYIYIDTHTHAHTHSWLQ